MASKKSSSFPAENPVVGILLSDPSPWPVRSVSKPLLGESVRLLGMSMTESVPEDPTQLGNLE